MSYALGSRIILVPALALAAAAAGCLALSACLVGWFPSSPTTPRPGEDEVGAELTGKSAATPMN